MTAPVNQHSGPEMHPEEPGGCQAINSQTPDPESIRERGEENQKRAREVNYLCSVCQRTMRVSASSPAQSYLPFQSFFILVLRKTDLVCVVNLLSSGTVGEQHDYGDLSFPSLMAFDRGGRVKERIIANAASISKPPLHRDQNMHNVSSRLRLEEKPKTFVK